MSPYRAGPFLLVGSGMGSDSMRPSGRIGLGPPPATLSNPLRLRISFTAQRRRASVPGLPVGLLTGEGIAEPPVLDPSEMLAHAECGASRAGHQPSIGGLPVSGWGVMMRSGTE